MLKERRHAKTTKMALLESNLKKESLSGSSWCSAAQATDVLHHPPEAAPHPSSASALRARAVGRGGRPALVDQAGIPEDHVTRTLGADQAGASAVERWITAEQGQVVGGDWTWSFSFCLDLGTDGDRCATDGQASGRMATECVWTVLGQFFFGEQQG